MGKEIGWLEAIEGLSGLRPDNECMKSRTELVDCVSFVRERKPPSRKPRYLTILFFFGWRQLAYKYRCPLAGRRQVGRYFNEIHSGSDLGFTVAAARGERPCDTSCCSTCSEAIPMSLLFKLTAHTVVLLRTFFSFNTVRRICSTCSCSSCPSSSASPVA